MAVKVSPRSRKVADTGVRPAMQARSRATRTRILKILEKSVQDDSIDRLTVADIAKRAKSSVGAFYGRFADKAAALDALYGDRINGLAEVILENNRSARRHRDVHRWIGDLANACLSHAQENQRLLARLAGRSAGLSMLPKSVIEDISNTITVLKIKPPHFAPPAADFLIKLTMGLSRDVALFRADATTSSTEQQAFVNDLQKAALWYLTAPSA